MAIYFLIGLGLAMIKSIIAVIVTLCGVKYTKTGLLCVLVSMAIIFVAWPIDIVLLLYYRLTNTKEENEEIDEMLFE